MRIPLAKMAVKRNWHGSSRRQSNKKSLCSRIYIQQIQKRKNSWNNRTR